MASTTISPPAAPVDTDALIASLYAPQFPAVEFITGSAGCLRRASNRPADGATPEGPSFYLSVGPGRIRIGSVDLARAQRRAERAGHTWQRDWAFPNRPGAPIGTAAKRLSEHAAWVDAEAVRAAAGSLADAGLIDPADVPEGYSGPFERHRSRARITEWTKKSQRTMLERYSTLDYGPLLEQGTPAMVTVTMPDRWEQYAPTGPAFKRLMRLFQKRFFRAWGRELVGLWKLEFQSRECDTEQGCRCSLRGAPHAHLLIVPPHGEAADGLRWRDWFASAWADCLFSDVRKRWDCAVDCEGKVSGWAGCECFGTYYAEERRKVVAVHSHRDASANYAEGLRASDPKRIAVYFLKHNLLRDKDYQHIVPQAWQGEGDGPGRFWGRWGLHRADVAVAITSGEAVQLARTLMRWERAKGSVRKVNVWRLKRVDRVTGELVYRKRTVTRRIRTMKATRGFMLVNDGATVALMLADSLRR